MDARAEDAANIALATQPVRTLLVDANAFERRGLRMLLRVHGIDVVAEASSGPEAVAMARRTDPDVVVIDAELTGPGDQEPVATLGALAGAPAVFVLAQGESVAALDALLAGAVGVVDKNARAEDIAAGVRGAVAGECVLSPGVARRLVDRARELDALRRSRERTIAPPRLSGRECDVLRLVVSGRGNADIGQQLYISSSTVKNHVAAIVEKLGVTNRVEAAVEAVRIGLVG